MRILLSIFSTATTTSYQTLLMCVFISLPARSTWLNILEPVHLAGVFDCQHIDLIKSSSVVTEMQNNVPFLSDVIKTWPFDDVPSDWNSCYQGMLHTVTKGPVEASKVGPEEYAQLFDLCAVQSHFVQAAIAGISVFCVPMCLSVYFSVYLCVDLRTFVFVCLYFIFLFLIYAVVRHVVPRCVMCCTMYSIIVSMTLYLCCGEQDVRL